MEMLLYGVPYIDVKDWKKNTDYKGEFSVGHQTIRWFWEVVEAFNQEELANLLKFSTGSSRTPIHGFKYVFFHPESLKATEATTPSF